MVATKYSESEAWADITPIPLNDGSTHYAEIGDSITPLVSIAYPEEYSEAMSYLRAIMAKNEMSDRALELTEHIIKLNPAHYTVWLYRAEILRALQKDPLEELAWLNKFSFKVLKNYQIWHHRETIVSNRANFPRLPDGEQSTLMALFAKDAKNYHVWTYRHWMVRHFQLWDDPQELRDVETLIDEDVRNNSAWSHRWVLKFGPRGEVDSGLARVEFGSGQDAKDVKRDLEVVDEDVVDQEIEYTKEKILIAPQNRSPWVYLRAVLKAANRPLSDLKGFASKFVDEVYTEKGEPEYKIKSTLAAEFWADCLLEEAEQYSGESNDEGTEKQEQGKSAAKGLTGAKAEAVRLLTALKEKYDPIRENYYSYRIRMI